MAGGHAFLFIPTFILANPAELIADVNY